MEGPDVDIPALLAKVEALFPEKDGPSVIKKQAATLILEKGALQHFQLRLHVLGHLLNTCLGRAWRHQYSIGAVPLSQLLNCTSGIFEVIPTAIEDVSAVRLNLAVLQALTAPIGKARLGPRPVATAHSNHSSPKVPGPTTPSPATAALSTASRSSPNTPLAGDAAAAAGASSSSSAQPKAPPVVASPCSAARQVGAAASGSSSLGAGSSGSLAPNSPAAGRASSSATAACAGYGNSVQANAVIAFIKVLKWKELSPNVNMLRRCLAADMVRRACDGTGRLAPDMLQYTIDAEDAVAILKRAWTGRFPDQRYPYPNLQHVLTGDRYLKLLPATANSSQRVCLLLKLLLQCMQGTDGDIADTGSAARLHRAVNTVVMSPSAAVNAVPATLPAILPAKRAGSAAAGGQLAGGLQDAVAASAGDEDMLAASAAAADHGDSRGLQHCSSVHSDAGSTMLRHTVRAAAPAGDADMDDASAAAAAAEIQCVPKKVVLNFIQKWQFDQNVDYNLMKKALATLLVNRAAGQHAQEVPVQMSKMQIHVAQAGQVFHKVWINRHGSAEKRYKKMSEVISNDTFFSVVDGPKHARQVVQLNIVKLAAAATTAAAVGAAADDAAEQATGSTDYGVVLPASPLVGGYSTSQSSMMNKVAIACSENNRHFAAAADAATAAAQSVALRVAQGCLLAVDLLGFADQIITWDANNEGLNLLRKQLAMRMIEVAHQGLAAAVAAGEQVLVDSSEERYVMSPYAAGNALMEFWHLLRPDQPRPYTTLPSAIAGDRYLQLKIGALGGNQLQLDIAQLIADCTATMKDLGGEWAAVAAAGAAAVAAKASGCQATAPAECETLVPDGATNGFQQQQQSAAMLLHSLIPAGTAVQNGVGHHTLYDTAAAAVDGMCALPVQPQQLQHGYSSRADHNHGQNIEPTGDLGDLASAEAMLPASPGGFSCAGAVQQYTGAVQQSPQIPSMSRLLEILRHAPPEICEGAGIVLVPHGVQSLLFSGNENDSVDQLVHLATDVRTAYAARNVRIITGLAGVNDLLDHLLACTMLCLGVACSCGSSSSNVDQQEMLLLQILAPPVVTQSGCVVDAAVYVFEVKQQQQQQQGENGAGGVADNQLANLMSILLEDANTVKLVEDSTQVSSLMHRYFNISVQGAMDARSLQEHLAAGGLLLGQCGDLPPALRDHLDAYQRAAGQLSSSQLMLRRLSSNSSHPLPAECIAGAASAVRPLVSLVHNAVELLPLAMMRRC